MIKTTGYIVAYTRQLPLDYPPHITFRWEGGDVVEISPMYWDAPLPKIGDQMWIGPYSVRLLHHDFMRDRLIVIRSRRIKWWFYVWLYHAMRLIHFTYCRLIITLAVWGLAYYDPNAVPSWRVIKGTKRLAAWIDNRQRAALIRRVDQINKSLK